MNFFTIETFNENKLSLALRMYSSCKSCDNVGAHIRSQPTLRWTVAQLRILSWGAYLN